MREGNGEKCLMPGCDPSTFPHGLGSSVLPHLLEIKGIVSGLTVTEKSHDGRRFPQEGTPCTMFQGAGVVLTTHPEDTLSQGPWSSLRAVFLP